MSTSPVLLLVAVLALFAAPPAEGQSPGKVYRLGMLSPAAPPAPSQRGGMTLSLMALRELGYVEGQNLVVERRFAEGKLDRLPALARELVLLRVDVIHATSASGIQAAKDATTTVPIVMGFGVDPVERGFVASLARPGGNITGVTVDAGIALAGKRLELIDRIFKGANPADLPVEQPTTFELVVNARTAKALGLTIPPSIMLRADHVVE